KLSRRPLRRAIHFTVELGPFWTSTVPGKLNKERPTQRYILWTACIPKGKKKHRFMSVLQAVSRPDNLGDQIHNPHLFEKVVLLPDKQDSEYVAKWCYRRAQRAMYYLLKNKLEKLVRPMLRVSVEDYTESYEPGAASSTLGQWREETMLKIAQMWLG